jgi:polyisoprenoid-binding protein YceI
MSTSTVLRAPSLTTWSIDPVHSIAEFKVKHMMISNVKGHFSEITGNLTIDESGHTNSRVEASIEAASIETRDGQRDGHLKSEDFFHVEKFPTLSFQSTSISRVGDGELSVEGDLTIRGVKRKVVFAVEGPTSPTKDPWGNTRIVDLCDHKNQPQGFRSGVERGAPSWRHSCRRRSDHHPGRAIYKSLSIKSEGG